MRNGSSVPLRVRRLGLHTQKQAVAVMRTDCHVCRSEGLSARSQLVISTADRSIQAELLQVESALLAENQIGLSEAAWTLLGVGEGDEVRIGHAFPPSSLRHVRARLFGSRFSRADLDDIIRDVIAGRYTDVHLSSFLTATAAAPLDEQETISLTGAMMSAGDRLEWGEQVVVDKHCIGGLPGNRTTPIVVAIVAACGLMMPKTSSRAITSPAGTADTMEMLANVNLSEKRISQIVREHRACLAWGGTADLSPADDVMISVERPLSLDSVTQMVASIMSKKVAAGSTHLLLDIPVGPSAKVRSAPDAQQLRKLFEYVASRMHVKLEVVITDGRQPIGRGIGPALEARDVMWVLENDPRAPDDLRRKSLHLAGRMIEFDPDVRGGDGFAIARDILESGRALAKMRDIISAQGATRFNHNDFPLARLTHQVLAPHDGMVTAIDNLLIAQVARLAGAPKVRNAGVELVRKLGAMVKAGDTLYAVHADFASDLMFAKQLCEKSSGYTIGEPTDFPHAYLEF